MFANNFAIQPFTKSFLDSTVVAHCRALAALALIAPMATTAEDFNQSIANTAAKASELEEVTVYAARMEQYNLELSTMVEVVDASDSDLAQANDVDDFLIDVSGVRVLDDVSGNEQRVYIRGFEEDQTLVLIDGRRQNITTIGEGRFYIDPELLLSAEVVKGAHSASHGGGAMAGLVAFETKSVDDLLKPGQSSALRTSLGYRNASSEVAPAVTGALRSNGVDFLISASGRKSDNIQQGDNSELHTNDQIASALFKSSYNASSYKLGLEARTHNNSGRQADENADDTETELSISDNQYSLRYQALGGSNPLLNPKAHLYMNDTSYQLEDLEGGSRGRMRGRDYRTLGAKLDYQHQAGSIHINELAYGLEIYQDEQDGYDNTSSDGDRELTPDAEATFGGIYFQDDLALKVEWLPTKIEKLIRLTAALRYDSFAYEVDGNSSSGSQLSPRLAINLTLSNSLKVFGSWALAYRPPTFYEISGGGNDNYTILPNQDLGPETVDTMEIGMAYQQRIGLGGFSLKGVYYQSIGGDYIHGETLSEDIDGAEGTTLQYANVNNALIKGIEIDGKLQGRALALSASLANTSAKTSSAGDYLEGNNVPWTLKTNLSYQVSSGTWGLRSIFVDEDDGYSDEEEYVPSYSVFDLYYSWPSNGSINGLKFASSVSNIFDEPYYKTNGSTIEEGMSYNLKLAYHW